MIGVAMIASATPPASAGEMAERHDAELIDEQADDDRGRAQQNVVDEADHDRKPRVAAVFGEIGAGEDADRRGEREADRRDDQAADDRVEQAAHDAGRRRHLGEYVERQAAKALPEQRAEDQRQPHEAERGGGVAEDGPDGVAAPCGRRRAGWPSARAFLLEPRQHQPRRRQHDERDDEQDEAEREQRGGEQARDRRRRRNWRSSPRSSCPARGSSSGCAARCR